MVSWTTPLLNGCRNSTIGQNDRKFDDPIILPMLEFCWGLYDDTSQHKLKGRHQLSNDALKVIARCILFLHSDKNYEWPYIDLKFSLKDLIFTFLTLGYYYVVKRKQLMISYKEWQNPGDYTVWPFFRAVDYNEQLKIRPFLAGTKEHETDYT
jgi:hypothetical protein